jgi:hypothetical protein
VAQEMGRFVGIHASPLAQQHALAEATAQRKDAEALAISSRRLPARRFAWVADAEAARTAAHRGAPGQRGRKPQRWRYQTRRSRIAALQQRRKRARRGRPPQGALPDEATRYRLVVAVEAGALAPAAQGWCVLATTVDAEVASEAPILQAYQEQQRTVEPGCRWSKNPAAITPVWLEQPARIAALAMLTVIGLLV